MYKKIYLDAPNLGESEKRRLNKAVDSGYVSTIGPFVPEFEERFAELIGVKKAVSTQSGTAAIYIALHELGIGKGDEVIIPALTFVATGNPVMYVGATPVFVDVNRATWNMDPEDIEKKITKKTKAIIAVHFYGNPCAMDKINRLAKRRDIYVIEDATESLGAKYKGRHTGTIGNFGCFSFNGNKIVTTGGGGMVTGDDTTRLEHIKFLVNQGRDESKGYFHPEVGFNFRMTNIEAALGLAQMKKLNKFLARKKRFYFIYRELLSRIDGIRFQEEYKEAESSRWFTCIYFEREINIVALQKRLLECGVPSRRVFMPLVEFPPYVKYKKSDYVNSYSIYEHGLCLPSSTLNSDADIRFVCNVIKNNVDGRS